jgi:TPR repeat protein
MALGERSLSTWFLVFATISFSIGSGPIVAGTNEDFEMAKIAYLRDDFATALGPMRRAADAGHADAQVLMGRMLDYTDQDKEAVDYYRKAAAAGNLDGIFSLGTMLATGEGVPKDNKEAFALYLRAAEGGFKPAIAAVAQVYIRGELDVSPESRKGKEALKWIRLSAEDGFLPALEALESAYRLGEYGISVDLVKAEEFKRRISELRGVKEQKRRRRGDR